MIEGIASAAVEPSQVASSASHTQKASQHQVRDFAAAMDRTQAGQATQAQGASDPAAAQAAKPTSEGMRAMMATLNRLDGGAESVRQVAERVASNPDASPSELIQLTMKCHEFMFQTQLTSNVANRTSDGIQQLFRQQS